jgi:bifunctional DNA-binding transcriptional regulator/antitoxin component of YhaV-PrlF toxin-antitoxin module
MTLNYEKVWSSMNELSETITNYMEIKKLLQHHNKNNDKFLDCVITLLDHYIEVQDKAFDAAWQETVCKVHEDEYSGTTLTCDKDDPSEECKNSWNDFWEEYYYPEEAQDDGMRPWGHSDMEYLIANSKQDKPKKWILPVEEVENGDTGEQEYFITFPDDLLEAANLTEGDQVEWVDNKDGTYTLKKIGDELARVKSYKEIGNELARVKTYQEMIDDGWSMTADGFWIKE